MANPNIGALTELNAGTLVWNLASKQVIPINSQSGNENDATKTYEHSYNATINNQTFADFIIIATGQIGGTQTWTSITHSGDTLTRLPAGDAGVLRPDNGASDKDHIMAYKVAPTAGDGENVVLTVSSAATVLAGTTTIFANVNQSTPFETFDFGGKGLSNNVPEAGPIYTGMAPATVIMENGSGSDGWFSNFMPSVKGDAGDLMVACFASNKSNDWIGPHVIYSSSATGRSDGDSGATLSVTALGGFDGGRWNPAYYHYGDTDHHVGGKDGTAERSMFLVHVKSSQTNTDLVTVPSGKVVRVASMRAINARDPGTYISVDVGGLGANVLDAAGASAVGASGGGATFPIVKDVRVPVGGVGVELIEKPIYLMEADTLKARINSTQHNIYTNATTADLVVTFEAID
tara:strand:- start:652 stop:1866 length:1215 start_codon:yes stop_codon:yes gene_type:complete